MHKLASRLQALTISILALCLCACSAGGTAGGPAETVESYLGALAAGDVNQMVSLSCSAREGEVRQEFNSFAAVTLNLKDIDCRKSGESGEAAVVTCSGSIIANYGAEDLEIDLAERPYRVIQEAGDWRVCGYEPR